jgi:urease accessory protein
MRGLAASKEDLPLSEPSAASGWQAELALRFARTGRGTRLVERRHRGPLMVQRPFYPEGPDVCHTLILHPPAGIVGGDELNVGVELDPDAHALITTPAATRWYFSRGIPARLEQYARVGDGAVLEWLPQETLVFDGAHAAMRTRIDLAGDARLLGWEIMGFGRPACGEKLRSGVADFRFEIFRDAQPLLLERWSFDGGEPAGMMGHTAWATLLASPAGEPELAAARAALATGDEGIRAATLQRDVLVVRALAAGTETLRGLMASVWEALRPLVTGRPAERPRIWDT